MTALAAFAVALTALGLFLAWKFSAAGRSRPVGAFMVTWHALLYCLGIVSTIVGTLFCLLAPAAALG